MAGVEQVSSKPQLQQYYCYGIDHNTMIRYNAHWEPRPTGQGHYYRVEDVDAFLATLRTADEPTPAPNVKRFKQRIDHGDVIESPSGELVRFADYERLDAWRRRLQAENERLAIRASEPPDVGCHGLTALAREIVDTAKSSLGNYGLGNHVAVPRELIGRLSEFVHRAPTKPGARIYTVDERRTEHGLPPVETEASPYQTLLCVHDIFAPNSSMVHEDEHGRAYICTHCTFRARVSEGVTP
jgi:hypothetical protein